MNTAYADLVDHFEKIALLQSCNHLLSWDQETHLPSKGVQYRAKQRAALSEEVHTLKTAPEVGDRIDEALGACQEGDAETRANLECWQHERKRACRIPAELVGQFEEVTSLAVAAWQEARQQNDFKQFQPHLSKIVEFNRKMADLWGYDDSPYDALLEEYERGARSKALTSLFDELQAPLVDLVQAATERSLASPPRDLRGEFPIGAQKAFNLEVCQAIGFDLDAGRIDTAAHPFCSRLAPNDTRLTTRYDVNDFTSSLYGVLHETGHGLYEQGLPQEKHALPSGTAVSLGIHESQSRLWENQVGRSRAFWERWLPVAQTHFPFLQDWSPEEITRAVNQARRSLIRVEADEVTYDLHIILRFEIERELIEGALEADDVPQRWNERFSELMGLAVTDDAEGCLQDIHWSLGAMGYFPTYSLGNLNAAQLFATAQESIPGITSELEAANYTNLLMWLRENVHALGSQLLPDELMQRATGQATQVAPYLDHLRSRYVDS